MLSTLTALVLAATVTNTETVHDLESFGGHVIACTEGGLELFSPAGQSVRVLTSEDGLPSPFCRALESTGDRLFVATDEGIVSLDASFHVEPVLEATWHALPPAEDASTAEYVERLDQLATALPPGATYTALSSRFAGTADGRVLELGTARLWTVPGPVQQLEDGPEGVKVGTTEGAFFIDSRGKLAASRSLPVGPLAFTSGPESALWMVGSDGTVTAWDAGPAVASRDATRVDGNPHPVPLPAGEGMLPQGATTVLWGGAGSMDWVGTRGSGVFRRASTGWLRVTPTGQLCGNHVTALTRYQGRLVVGTFDRGVCWQRGDGRWQTFRAPALPSNQVLGLASDERNLYVATTYGLGLYDGKAWTQVAYGGRNPIALAKLSVLAAARVDDGMAVVDGRGVSIVTPGSAPLSLVKRLPLPEAWSDHPSVAHGAGHFLWLASEDRGLLRWDGARWQRFHDGRDLTDNWITALDTDPEGRAIAGTCQDGFSYFDGARWTRVRTAQGLPSSAIVATALVPGGALLGTLRGAAYFEASTGTVHALPRLADPRVYAVRVEDDTAFFGTEGGLSQLPWSRLSAPALSQR